MKIKVKTFLKIRLLEIVQRLD